MNVYEAQAHLAANRIPFSLCTVIDGKGSIPSKAGAKMVITSNETFGTIGGGELELRAVERARKMLSEKSAPSSESFSLFYKKEGGMDLACGGTATVFFEVIVPPPHLLVCGGGHLGHAFSRIMDLLGYAYSIVDPRPQFGAWERFPKAAALFESLGGDRLHQFDYAVIFTHSQELDLETLLTLHAGKFAGKILLIGSKAKWNDFRKRLQEAGVAEDFFNQVECPAGIPIKAASVPEIALSLAGWVVSDYRNHGA